AVQLPFVPVPRSVGRPWPSCARRFGSMALAMSPPIIPPAPRPVFWDAHVARSAAWQAMRLRRLMRRVPPLPFGFLVFTFAYVSPAALSVRPASAAATAAPTTLAFAFRLIGAVFPGVLRVLAFGVLAAGVVLPGLVAAAAASVLRAVVVTAALRAAT